MIQNEFRISYSSHLYDKSAWNSLSADIWCATEIQTFKKLFKSYLFRQAFNVLLFNTTLLGACVLLVICVLQVFSDDDDDDDDECLHNAHPSNGHTSALICSVTNVTHSLICNSVGS